MKETRAQKGSRFSQEDLERLFRKLFNVGIVLVLCAALGGCVVDPDASVDVEPGTLAGLLSLAIPDELAQIVAMLPVGGFIARCLLGLLMGLGTAIVLGALLLIAYLVCSQLVTVGEEDIAALEEPPEIAEALAAQLSTAGFGPEDSETFLRARRGFLAYLMKKESANHRFINVTTAGDFRFDAVRISSRKVDTPGKDDPPTFQWLLEKGYVFAPVVEQPVILQALAHCEGLLPTLYKLLPQAEGQVRYIGVRPADGFELVFVGASAPLNTLKAGPTVYSLSEGRVLKRHKAWRFGNDFSKYMKKVRRVEFEVIGKLPSARAAARTLP